MERIAVDPLSAALELLFTALCTCLPRRATIVEQGAGREVDSWDFNEGDVWWACSAQLALLVSISCNDSMHFIMHALARPCMAIITLPMLSCRPTPKPLNRVHPVVPCARQDINTCRVAFPHTCMWRAAFAQSSFSFNPLHHVPWSGA